MSIFDRLFGAKPSEPTPAEYQARLLNPDWAAVQRALGRPAPLVLRELYEARELIVAGDFLLIDPAGGEPGEWYINQFVPADANALAPELESIPAGAFNFAYNEYGDPYYVELSSSPDGDGAVRVHHHDGDDTELVANSLRAFLRWNRRAG